MKTSTNFFLNLIVMILFAFHLLVLVSCGDFHSVTYKRYDNSIPISSFDSLGTIQVADEFMCMHFCNMEPNCSSLTFQKRTKMLGDRPLCELHSLTMESLDSKLLLLNEEFDFLAKTICDRSPCGAHGTCVPVYEKNDFVCTCATGYGGRVCDVDLSTYQDCKIMASNDNVYNITISGNRFEVYCDVAADQKAWSLAARFSNNDNKNWMQDAGEWWYDQQSPAGDATNPSTNQDMISPAFWLVKGAEFKLTRSDDPTHTPLLVTLGNCLGGVTFRDKMTSFGNFRQAIWAHDQCRGTCSVQYGGLYSTTHGFLMSSCDGGLQNRDKIGFWCDYNGVDGSVIMIGGGGIECEKADHGLGISEANGVHFAGKGKYDFGNYGYAVTKNYSINVWVGG